MLSAEELAKVAARRAEIQQILSKRWGKRQAIRRTRLLEEVGNHLAEFLEQRWQQLKLIDDAEEAQEVIDYYLPRAQYLIENAPIAVLTRIEEEPTIPRRFTRLLMGLKRLADARG